MRIPTLIAVVVSLLLAAAIFGFFYAWVCSTLWGLDLADPRVAMAAMQAMNGSVRNMAFAPAFFGTPFALLLAAGLLWRDGLRPAALGFGFGGVVYLLFGMGLTLVINVPMNEALAVLEVPADREAAAVIWAGYSADWQFWNLMRTLASGFALLAAITGLLRAGGLPRPAPGASRRVTGRAAG